MQFSIATLAVLATAVMAETTLYVTEEVTITSCAATVTDCPARSTVVSLTTYPVITGTAAPTPVTYTRFSTVVNTITSCAPTVTNCPVGKLTTTVIPITSTWCPPTNGTAYTAPAPKPTSPAAPVVVASSSAVVPVAPVSSPAAPAPSVVTVTVNYCPAPTSLVPVPVKAITTPAPAAPGVPTTAVAVVPVVSSTPNKPSNGTTVVPTTPAKFTGAAATMTGSFGAMAVAGLIAVFFA